MIKIAPKQQKVVGIFIGGESMSSSDVRSSFLEAGEDISLVTVKRTLSKMVSLGILQITGAGRATKYKISSLGRIFADIDAQNYCTIEPDHRLGLKNYNFDLLSAIPPDIFSDSELEILDRATVEYEKRTEDLPPAIQKKELERLIIELSWKSSKIEGNTYTLLDTEKLILENKEAPGKSKQEAQMILNHKDAFHFIRSNKDKFKTLTRKNIEELHAFLVKDLSVGFGLRKKAVGVVGSIYKPLDNIHQIEEAVSILALAVDKMASSYAKALVALLGISYIQPFEDGNKRTGRLMANALLLSYGLAPLSYRNVEEKDFREATLVFFEINSILPFKKIFISQYKFAAKNYAAK